ncbi:hypothetical protein E1B28_009294 [Marasmius oreades]|uniref:Gamma-glutamylcyclotransferase AIG2-like domain-containing protein n=1 Tax=Marasmius oreades TaxID=181124 RepID=A0A9P7S0S9_9AGAR|nr:uncharacterized protein E1B28_009294 [Marasmius oreades]KAG7092995.1 hypothetical protein E1B28_009294 [Marasmius oreades]
MPASEATRIRMWGPYPALVKRAHEDVTTGKAWILHEESHLKKLVHYETKNYRFEAVDIWLDEDSSPISGYTFVWNGRDEDLHNGAFDMSRFG